MTHASASGHEVFVASYGDDAHEGTREKPLASLGKAAALVREVRAAAEAPEPTTVWVAAGTYYMGGGLHLTAEDSGTSEAPINYRAMLGEEVRLSGGWQVADFHPLTETELRAGKIAPEVRTQVVVADLSAEEIADLGVYARCGFDRPMEPASPELFYNDAPMTPARWPNFGWARTAATSDDRATDRVVLDSDRAARWADETGALLHGFWAHDWADSYERLASISIDGRTVTTQAPHAEFGYAPGARFYAVNVLAELDTPGEYYVCRNPRRLYFFPPADAKSGRAVLSIVETPVSTYGTSHVALEGFIIEASRVCGVEIVGGTNVVVSGCTIRNIGNLAVSIYGGARHRVVDCRLSDLGEGAIRVDGGDLKSLTPGEHEIAHNRLERFNRRCHGYRPAVNVYGVGQHIRNNLILEGSHAAVVLHGNDHVVEGNEIHSVCRETDDVGAIMLAGGWTDRGNVVRHNYIHDLGGPEAECVAGVYLDDFASETTVEGNAFVRAGRGVIVGGGRDNDISGNLIAHCRAGVQIDCRGVTWRADYLTNHDSTLRRRLVAATEKESSHLSKYPRLATLLADEPAIAKGNRIVGNICSGPFAIDLQDGLNHEIVIVERNLTGADPKFVDASNGDFRLRNDSPAHSLGIQAIPWERIGLRVRNTALAQGEISSGE